MMNLLRTSKLYTLVLLSIISATSVAAEPEIATLTSATVQGGSCPDNFYDLPLYPKARLCQIFADQPPASLTYHADAQIDQTKSFYLEQLGPAESEKMLQGRLLLQYQNSNKIIVISEDGNGSQVDVLIKSDDITES